MFSYLVKNNNLVLASRQCDLSYRKEWCTKEKRQITTIQQKDAGREYRMKVSEESVFIDEERTHFSLSFSLSLSLPPPLSHSKNTDLLLRKHFNLIAHYVNPSNDFGILEFELLGCYVDGE
jgi:hypothetical protein